MIEEKVVELANLRRDFEYTKRLLAESELRLMETDIGVQVIGIRTIVKTLADEIESVREQIDSVALQIYANDGNKHPHPAVSIRDNNKLLYDVASAIQWALKVEQKDMISLNKSVFEKAAKALDLDFVEKRKEPSVTIGTDLSAYEGNHPEESLTVRIVDIDEDSGIVTAVTIGR